MLDYVKLKEKPREFLAATGLSNEEFKVLLPNFENCLAQAFEGRSHLETSLIRRKRRCSQKSNSFD